MRALVGHPGLEPGANGLRIDASGSERFEHGENDGLISPVATVQTAGPTKTLASPTKLECRASLISSLYEHSQRLVKAGDLTAAKVAHDAAGKLLEGFTEDDVAVVIDLNKRRDDHFRR